ncbi:MAG: GntR family transcriptional regulator [Candidatus Hydrogenedentota bacterium]|nr:MAG: GntR family transcriptional regulator [Candidatus Hydrogenedentota bacterium]
MYLKIDATNGVPLYLQIAREVKHSIAVGSLRPGDQLPSVREVAFQITVNPNTVAKAYRELEAQGAVVTRRGTGTFVPEKIVTVSEEEKMRTLTEMVDRAIDEARHLQVDENELIRLFHDRIAAFQEESEKSRGARDD